MNSIQRTPVASANSGLLFLLSLLALASVAVGVFAPIDRGASRITWVSERDPNPSVLSIADPVESLALSGFSAPDILLEPVVFSGAYFSSDDAEEQVATLRVVIDENGVTATLVSPRGEIKEIVGPVRVGGGTGGFPSEWTASVADRELRLTTNRETLTAPLPTTAWFELGIESGWAEVSGADDFALSYTVTMTGGSLRAPGPLHAWAIWTAIGLITITLFLLSRSTGAHLLAKVRALRLSGSDVAVATALVIFALIAPVAFDDGWVFAWGRELTNSPWGPTSPFMIFPGDPQQNPQGFLFYSLLGITAGQTTSVIGMRSLTVVMLFVMWLIFSRALIPRLFPTTHRDLILPATTLMLLFSYSWMTLRSEIPLALLSALFFSLALSQSKQTRVLRLTGYSVVTGAALSIHPNGMVLVIPWIIFVVRDLHSKYMSWIEKAIGLTLGAAIALVLIFFNLTFSLLGEFLREYPTSSQDPFNEWARFSAVFEIGSLAQRVWFIAGVIGLISLWTCTIHRLLSASPYSRTLWVLIAMSLMPLGMAFGSSKLPWHYASLAVPFLIGLLLTINYMTSTHRRQALRVLAVSGTIAWVALAAKDANIPVTWIGLENDNLRMPLVWSVVILATTAALSISIVSVNRIRAASMLGLLIGSVTLIVVGTTLSAAVEVSRMSASGWSFLKQSTLGLIDSDLRCGLPDFIPVGSKDGPRASEVITSSGFTARVPLHMTLQNPCVPPAGRINGSWSPVVGSSIFERFGGQTEWSPLNDTQLRSGCVEIATLNERSHEVCFLENYPAETPARLADRITDD